MHDLERFWDKEPIYVFTQEKKDNYLTLDVDLSHPTNRNHALSTELQLLIALRYYATGSMQKVSTNHL